MIELAQMITKGAFRGLQDSVVGVLKIPSISKELEAKEEEKTKNEQSQRLTVLARRRAERMKSNPNLAKKQSPPKMSHRIFLCCIWNGGVFWLSLLIFDKIVLPCFEFLTQMILGNSALYNTVWSYAGPLLTSVFSAFWVLPLFILSKTVNGFWFQDIADCAYRRKYSRPLTSMSFSGMIADVLFSLVMQALFLIQGMLVKLVPVYGIGEVLYVLHMCLLYSLYAFEYKWFNMSWPVHKRVASIECNWSYFAGFGFPLAILTYLPSSFFISGCVFSIFFPLFIISADEATPVPQAVDLPLRLFSPVIYLSNIIFQKTVKLSTDNPSSTSGTPKKVNLGAGASHQ